MVTPTFDAAAWIGIVFACLTLTGLADCYSTWFSMLVWAILWVLYLSFVNVGQTFYGFGWESILLEAGFFTIFLGSRGVVCLSAGVMPKHETDVHHWNTI